MAFFLKRRMENMNCEKSAAARLHESQYTLVSGPTSNRPIRVADVADVRRWQVQRALES